MASDLRAIKPYIAHTSPIHITVDDKIDGRLIIVGDVHGKISFFCFLS